MTSSPRPPVLFLSHGAPPLADDATWTRELQQWGSSLPRPTNILVVSAHWENAPAAINAYDRQVPLVYDFWGFEQRYYEVTYATPPATQLAHALAGTLATPGQPLHAAADRGLDHGAYVPLVEMFPAADIPVLQLSLPTLEPTQLFELGRRLGSLRDDGTLIVGSGFTTHNLSWAQAAADATPPAVSAEFDAWAAERMAAGDVDALLDFETQAPAAHEAHPRTEHWAPLFVALGAADATDGVANTSVVDGFWHGLSKRSWQFG